MGAGFDSERADSVRRHVGLTRGHRLRKWIWRLVALLLVGLAGAAVVYWQKSATREPGPSYETQPVRRGNLRATVSATGTLSGMDMVEVGAEISGTIRKIHFDFNDKVKEGDLLCEIDPEQLAAARNQAVARLSAAKASKTSAEATAKETALEAARAQNMAREGLISDQQLQAALAAAERAQASVKSTSADIALSQASLKSSQTSLDKTKIRSPIDGIVLSRNVEVGQTVAASMTTPVLFVLAKDLKRMELTVAVDEADIGRVREGQKASFTVDAYPNRKFSAVLKSLRNLPTTTNNVVTYEAVLEVNNDDLALRPGMTATATIVTEERKNVLLAPNAALRFEPLKTASSSAPRGFRLFGPPRRPPGARKSNDKPGGPPGSSVWILRNGQPEQVRVETGLSDGQSTELVKGPKEGTELVVDMLDGA
jgi:HlyD family secretion protein